MKAEREPVAATDCADTAATDPTDATVRFHALDENAAHYPRPFLPMVPVARIGAFLGRRAPPCPSRFLADDVTLVRNGRTAIAEVLQAAGVGPEGEVIIPAYHCRTMVDPARWLGARIAFCRIRPDLSLDTADVLGRMGPRTRALLVPHYFGFPQILDPLLEACRARGVAVVEDCAHAFFTTRDGLPAGSAGDYAIASLTKFFPGADGGAYCANGRARPLHHGTRRRLGAELRAAVAVLEASAAHGGHTTVLRSLAAINRLRRRCAHAFTADAAARPAVSGAAAAGHAGGLFDPHDRERPMSLAATWLARASVTSRIAANRRRNYAQLARELAGVAGGRALLPQLPEGVVPYMFPWLIDDPARHFAPLKRLGVPIWRWEDIAHSDCEVSLDYRLRLLQLPCHQSLEPADIDRIVRAVRGVLG